MEWRKFKAKRLAGACFSGNTAFALLRMALWAALAWRAGGQVVGKGNRMALPYPPPHQDRLKFLTTADEIQPRANEYLAQRLKIQTFAETGPTNVQFIIEAPDCLVSRDFRNAHSPGPLVINSGNGQLHLEGEGFSWLSSSNSTLTISNQVRTTLKLESLSRPSRASGTNNVLAPMAPGKSPDSNQIVHIYSDHFFFDHDANLITYTGNVRVEDTEMDLTCAMLTVHLLAGGDIDNITAEREVGIVIKPDGGRATGDHAVYTARGGRKWVELTGSPHWQNGPSEATGAIFVFDQINRTLRVEGQAWLKFPRPVTGGSGMLLFPAVESPAKADAGEDQFIEAFSDSMLFQFPPAEGAPGQGRVESVLAEGKVAILDHYQHSRATSARAFVNTITGRMELTGKAIWQADQRLARGEIINFDNGQKSFSARTNAYLKFPVSAFGGIMPGGAAASPNAGAGTNQFIEAISDSYDYQNNVLTLRDQVHTAFLGGDAIMGTLDSRQLTATFSSTKTNQLESLVAEQDVYARQLSWLDRRGNRFERELKTDRLTVQFRTNGLVEEMLAEQHVAGMQTEIPAGKDQPIVSTLHSDLLTARFSPTTNTVESIVAEHNVLIAWNEMTASEDQAVYTASNGVARLLGNVRVRQPGQIDWSGVDVSMEPATGRILGHRTNTIWIPVPDQKLRSMKRPEKPQP